MPLGGQQEGQCGVSLLPDLWLASLKVLLEILEFLMRHFGHQQKHHHLFQQE